MLVIIRLVAFVLFAALTHAPAGRAQSMPPWRTCPDPDGVDGYAQQSADTADGRESTARVLKNCGFAWMDKSEWKLAIRFFSLSIEKNPGADDTYYGRALAREKIGDKAGAEIDLAMSRSIAR